MATWSDIPTADTYLRAVSPTYNYGAYSSFDVRNNLCRPLLRFDLSSIPSGATCVSASLALTPYANVTSFTYNLFKISDANGDWVEGTKAPALAGAGEPCWNAKVADGAGGVTTAWAGSAGLSTAGTDYINTVLATFTGALTANTQADLAFNNDGLAILQGWFGDVTNNGFILFSTNTAAAQGFWSKEYATESYRPVLSVTYTAAGGVKRMNGVHRINSINQIRHIGG